MKEYRQQIVDLTQRLIQIESHKFAAGREREVARFFDDYCRRLGFASELAAVDGVESGRCNVIVRLSGSGGGRTLLLNGHLDTIPAYRMDFEPFAAFVKDGFIHGRGANDMKGALACMLYALVKVRQLRLPLRGDVILAAVIGEEEESEGTEALVLSGIKADGAIVGEPSDYQYAVGHRGLEWIRFTFSGSAGHTGSPERAVNAIEKASDFIRQLRRRLRPQLAKRSNPFMGPSVYNIGKISGGSQPSSVADSCELLIDRRYIAGESTETVLAGFNEIIADIKKSDKDFQVKMELMAENQMRKFCHTYLETDINADIVQTVRGCLQSFLGREPEITAKRGWTDAAVLSTFGHIPTIVLGPGKIDNSHTKNERIAIDDLVNMSDIYADIIGRFCR